MHIRRGFTLIELLVVMIMIGVMLAMIQPMLAGSAAKSRELMCESHLRQIGMAAHSYAEDYAAFPKTLNAIDLVLEDRSLLKCPNTPGPTYSPPQGGANRMLPIASCIDPANAHKGMPHRLGGCYLQLRAGGAVLRMSSK